ncbi:glycosyltransferase family 4 protein [Sphingobium baderi]|uniref:glycosyltransferase family 4 protein n=1 Tax=Sphingobium baderi TaxID=1332080 RepID=UPI002B411B6B|nr:glycosyltransferase family 1 protein [Sphingobium baderi]WRD78815.1 glycosyltransferase family 1 protein [Sphingobium baderi]
MPTPFTVFVDGHSFDTGWQGTTTYLTGVLNALPEAMARIAPDLELRLICSGERNENIGQHVTAPFEFVPVCGGFFRRNAIDIPLALRASRADLMVSQYVRPFFAPCQTMSVIHDVLFLDLPASFSWKYRMARRILFGWSAQHSSIISTVSEYSADRINKYFGVHADAIEIIPNAIDPAFQSVRRSPRQAGAPLRLLSVSRLERRKRLEWGIAAQEALAGEGIKSEYTIIGGGDGAYAKSLRAEVKAASKRGLKVEIRSDLALRELIEVYAESDVFIFPAEAEGFGIPVIEAAGAGVPCVVSDGGALAEFKGSFVGETFPSDDKDAFLAAVLRVARDLAALRDTAELSRYRVLQTYSWDRAAERYARIFRNIAMKKS